MNEVELRGEEKPIRAARKKSGRGPLVTMTKHSLYFNRDFTEIFPGNRVKISRSGPYIVFRPASGTTDSYALKRRKKYGSSGSIVESSCLMQLINPDGDKHTYPVMPVKGGGWCIKVR